MTGSFRDACFTATARTRGSPGSDIIPKTAFVVDAARRLGVDGLTDKPQTDISSLNEIAESLLGLVQAGIALSSKQLRQAIWCLWETTPALADEPLALTSILEGVATSQNRKPFRNMATVYLVQFRPDRPGLAEVSGVLQRWASRWGEPWATYQQTHLLYDPIQGPKNIAARALRENISPAEAMQSLGLGALDAKSGYSEEITRNLLVDLSNGAEPDHYKRIDKVRAYVLDSRGEITFRTLDAEIAEALIKPFIGRQPDRQIKDFFLNFIVSLFRDPRIHPARWDRFPQIKALVISWLTEQSLRQFLDIVGRTIDDPSDAEMWRYRRAFWEAAHRKGIIKGAWVVFAEEGAIRAKRTFGNNTGFGTFSSQGGKQVQRTHAVLLLEIGRGVVADWSHSGKVNIWADAADKGAPQLYRQRYSSDDVTISNSRYDIETERHLVKTHHAPKNYNWQRVVAQRIYQMTNMRLQDSDYKA